MYAIMRTEKHHTMGEIAAMGKHNERTRDTPKSVSTNPPCSKGIVSKPTGAQSVVPWVSGGRAHRHRAVPGVWRLRAGEFGASGDRWWTQDRVFFGNNGPRGRPEGKVEGPWVCGHALRLFPHASHPAVTRDAREGWEQAFGHSPNSLSGK